MFVDGKHCGCRGFRHGATPVIPASLHGRQLGSQTTDVRFSTCRSVCRLARRIDLSSIGARKPAEIAAEIGTHHIQLLLKTLVVQVGIDRDGRRRRTRLFDQCLFDGCRDCGVDGRRASAWSECSNGEHQEGGQTGTGHINLMSKGGARVQTAVRRESTANVCTGMQTLTECVSPG